MTAHIVELETALPHGDRVHPRQLVAMLIAARTTFLEHREIAAVLVTYGLFLTSLFGLAWAVA